LRLTDEQATFARHVREYCAREFGTVAQRDALTDGGKEIDSREVLERMGEMGWLGVSIPEEYGGSGSGMVEECIFLEETSRGLAPIHGYSASLTAGASYLRWGTEDQKREVLGKICRGRLVAIALSEPGSGSDLASARCPARRDGDTYVIDGHKTWITNAHTADDILVLVRTDASGVKYEGLTLLHVPADTPGIEVRPIQTMGAHIVNDVFFDDVRVPAENVVGEEGRAWAQLSRGLAVERLIIAAMGLGVAERAFHDTLAYVTEREQFGQAIGRFQAIKHRIADIATEIACCRALVYDIADQLDAGDEDHLARKASMAKLKCTSVAKEAALEGMQMMGGYGYTREYGMEGVARYALGPPIYGGTNEIQREIIGKSYGL
jgi:alkylation response protein AidB-like acyl-CoA dehydrogenase